MKIKKLVSVLVVCLLIVATYTFCGCKNDIETQRSAGKEEISNYLVGKEETDYYNEDWILLHSIMEGGNEDIESASTLQEIRQIVCETKMKIDGIVPKTVSKISDGFYYLSDDSWEWHVRNFARECEKDETWIRETIDNNGEEVTERGFVSRNYYSAVIIGNRMTISQERYFPYLLSKDNNGAYIGKMAQREIVLYAVGDELYVKESFGNTMHFRKDSSYSVSEDSAMKRELETPQDVSFVAGKKTLTFTWGYHSEYGPLGAVGEIKRADEEKYVVRKHEVVYMNQFVFQLEVSELHTGDNYLRIYHSGGPLINRYKESILYIDSDYVTFLIRVGDEIKIEEI